MLTAIIPTNNVPVITAENILAYKNVLANNILANIIPPNQQIGQQLDGLAAKGTCLHSALTARTRHVNFI